MNATYMHWADQKVPALDNHTPRDLVKFPDGRRRVAAPINDFENRDARHPNPQFRFDYNNWVCRFGLAFSGRIQLERSPRYRAESQARIEAAEMSHEADTAYRQQGARPGAIVLDRTGLRYPCGD